MTEQRQPATNPTTMSEPRRAHTTGRALLVIDMQNLFCHPNGTVTNLVGPLYAIEETVPRVVTAVADTRSRGDLVIYTRHCYDANYRDAGPNFPGPNPIGVTGAELMEHRAFVAGTWDSDILDVLAPEPDDVVIDKTRYDAFLGTPLESVLRGSGVRELEFCGVVTNICVESTARSAYMRDFTCTVLRDATTAGTGELHDRALRSLESGKFARLRPTRQAV